MKRLIGLFFITGSLLATDFAMMSTQQLQAMRGEVPAQDRPAYQAEMQKRMQSMTNEERQAYQKENSSYKNRIQSGDSDQFGTGRSENFGRRMGGGRNH